MSDRYINKSRELLMLKKALQLVKQQIKQNLRDGELYMHNKCEYEKLIYVIEDEIHEDAVNESKYWRDDDGTCCIMLGD